MNYGNKVALSCSTNPIAFYIDQLHPHRFRLLVSHTMASSSMLTMMGVAVPVPQQLSDADATKLFEELCTKFGIDPKVCKYLRDTMKLQSLDDFLHAFSKSDDIQTKCVDLVQGLATPAREVSRLRQAWDAVRQAELTGLTVRKRGADDCDFDKLLSGDELRSYAKDFWDRYKVRFSAYQEPSDYLVSRIAKEIERRMCQVHPVLKVKSLMHQVRQDKHKRLKASDDFDLVITSSQDESMEMEGTVHNYLLGLFTLLLAYGKVGSSKLSTAPAVLETIDKDSTDYVSIPWDILMAYHGRIQRCAAQLPTHVAFTWIKQRDEAERQLWIEMHRTSDQTLGKIIKEIFNKREAVWEISRDIADQLNRSSVKSAAPVQPTRVGNQPASSNRPSAALASTLKNGTAICADFQTSKGCSTKGAKCGQGLHCCAVLFKNGRVCGMSNHNAIKCTKKPKSH